MGLGMLSRNNIQNRYLLHSYDHVQIKYLLRQGSAIYHIFSYRL
jgi:hypothetical protein